MGDMERPRGIVCKGVLDCLYFSFPQGMERGGGLWGTYGRRMAEAGADAFVYIIFHCIDIFPVQGAARTATDLRFPFHRAGHGQFPCHLAAAGNIGAGEENTDGNRVCKKDRGSACPLPGYAGGL